MRLVSYFIFTYIVLGLQIGVAPFVAFHGVAPNLVLLAVVFVALNAPKDAALLGCFALGVIQDLLTQQSPGLYAFSYGLLAMFIVAAQPVVDRDHPLTHVSLALIGGLLTAFVLMIHSWIHPAGARTATEGNVALPAIRIPIGLEFLRALYTAALAPFILFVLQRTRKVFAFQPTRKKSRFY
ncbi:MAG TPA: rod shape-determining protein MreD [Tepidisphaeraceae bacterium]|nr:rod shape-determining protein MreD [Tepidisphaeraceae bacterium]